jgi:hypothetical protein
MPWAETLLVVPASYAALGFVFAVAFVTVGVERLDPAASHAGKAFRLIILPGAICFWPLLLRRWIRGRAIS